MHRFVQQHQAVKIKRFIRLRCFVQQAQRLLQRAAQVVFAALGIQQGQFPAQRMGNGRAVIPSIAMMRLADHRASASLRIRVGQMAQIALRIARYPALLKPAHMTQFPERKIELLLAGHIQQARRFVCIKPS